MRRITSKAVADRIKKRRKELQLGVYDLAVIMEVTPECLYHLERGSRLPSVTVLKALSIALNISSDELLGLKD